jgi:hypothetical protein
MKRRWAFIAQGIVLSILVFGIASWIANKIWKMFKREEGFQSYSSSLLTDVRNRLGAYNYAQDPRLTSTPATASSPQIPDSIIKYGLLYSSMDPQGAATFIKSKFDEQLSFTEYFDGMLEPPLTASDIAQGINNPWYGKPNDWSMQLTGYVRPRGFSAGTLIFSRKIFKAPYNTYAFNGKLSMYGGNTSQMPPYGYSESEYTYAKILDRLTTEATTQVSTWSAAGGLTLLKQNLPGYSDSIYKYALIMSEKNVNAATDFIKSKMYSGETTELSLKALQDEAGAFMNSLKAQEDIIQLTMNGIPGTLNKDTYPRDWVVYALNQTGNDPVSARKYIFDNRANIQAQVLNDTNPAEYTRYTADQPTWQSSGSLKDRSCKELSDAKATLKTLLANVRTPVQDMSGTAIAAQGLKAENMKYQYQFRELCSQDPISDSCKDLASLDPNIFETLGPYDATNKLLYEKEIDIQDSLDAINSVMKGVGCPITDLSGFTVEKDIGIIDSEMLKLKMEELSPYYIAPVVLQYLTKLLVGAEEIDAASQTSLTNLRTVTTNIQGIKSMLGNMTTS